MIKKIIISIVLLYNSIICNAGVINELKEKFNNVLLVVHYNHPFYQTIPFIRTIYSEVFPHIVFFGEFEHPQVNTVRTQEGHKFSRVVAETLTRFSGYDGYIFLQDDCMMNFWNYLRFDTEKIWFCTNLRDQFLQANILDPSTHYWWFSHPKEGVRAVRQALDRITPAERAQLEANHGVNRVIGQACDMFYIPCQFASQAEKLSRIFQQVFCEISIPMILSCIDSLDHWEKMNTLWSGATPEKTIAAYTPQYDWVHPLKFSSLIVQNFCLQQAQFNLRD